MSPASVVLLVVGLIIFLASGCTCPRMTEASVYISLISIAGIVLTQKRPDQKPLETAFLRNCTDVPSPQMMDQGILQCPGYTAFARLCYKSTTWSKNWYCDKSCQEAGFGYPGSACAPLEPVEASETSKGFVHNFLAWADEWVVRCRWLQEAVRDLNLFSNRMFIILALVALMLGGVALFRSTVGLEALFYCILIAITLIAYTSSHQHDPTAGKDPRFNFASIPNMDGDIHDYLFFNLRECTDCFKDVAMPAASLDWTMARQDPEVLKVIGEDKHSATLKDEEYRQKPLQFTHLKLFCDNKGGQDGVHIYLSCCSCNRYAPRSIIYHHYYYHFIFRFFRHRQS